MSRHPDGLLVDILGIEDPSQGRSCSEHAICGSVLKLDVTVRLRSVHIRNDEGEEEMAIAAYWVTCGIDRCRVGFFLDSVLSTTQISMANSHKL
jgi:hypothetical protein